MKSVLIRGGRVVDAGGERVADVAVEDGRIATVVADGSDLAGRVMLWIPDRACSVECFGKERRRTGVGLRR